MTQNKWTDVWKKPVKVEAKGPFTDTDVIETIEGDFEIDDEYLEEHGAYYLIRGVNDEIYPIAEDIFNETYVTESDIELSVPEHSFGAEGSK